jgi:very-short-patch-repair endonuclease
MMICYNQKNKFNARNLRSNQTDAESLLWLYLRRKQINNIQFYRQRPIGNYIVDFYAPSSRIVIEVDGGQHFEEEQMQRDRDRDSYLQKLGLKVLRFDNLQVIKSIDSVLEMIYGEIQGP